SPGSSKPKFACPSRKPRYLILSVDSGSAYFSCQWVAKLFVREVPMKHPIGQIALGVLIIVIVPLLGGCGSGPEPLPGPMVVTEAQSQKLMAMAAEEA